MSAANYSFALWMVVVWPLLLAFPVLHSRLPWPRHLAILPAVVLVVFTGNISLELPRVLFGTGFTIDGEVRWVLAMTMIIWLIAATMAESSRNAESERSIPFFMLTLAGNLGAVLTIDLAGFFSFSTIMGYGFYGMLVQDGNAALRRAGRLYLIFVVIADLILFESLLLAVSTTANLQFDVVHQAMTGASSSQFYVWMTLAGFMIKAGIWPAHLWLSALFKSASPSTILLLGGVPIAMGLLGAIRWLPIGEQGYFNTGLLMQITGMIAILYAALRFLTHITVKGVLAWVTVAITGLLMAALGTALAHPVIWPRYEFLAYPCIASLGIFLALLAVAIDRTQGRHQQPDYTLQQQKITSHWTGRWFAVAQGWTSNRLLWLHSLWCSSILIMTKPYQYIQNWQNTKLFLSGWSTRITLFVLLGLALAWMAA